MGQIQTSQTSPCEVSEYSLANVERYIFFGLGKHNKTFISNDSFRITRGQFWDETCKKIIAVSDHTANR